MTDARVLRDEGIERAVDHADATSPSWSTRAFSELVRLGPGLRCFTATDIRERANVPPPPDARAWGGVMVRAVKLGLIERIGYVPNPEPRAHMRPTAEYRWRNR